MKNSHTKIELEKAIEQNEFQLYYQPKLDLVSGKIQEVEALIRWLHPQKGFIPPLEFIPVAEKTNMILPIGEWVIRTACKQGKEWQDKGISPICMAVNLSACQLYQPDFVEKVKSILKETQLSPEYLELEITESMTIDVNHILPVLQDLKGIGVRISMDDFGTGYSSLYHLKEFPIDAIKIDQSFVRTCTTNSKDATIVKTIIAMAHQLKLDVIAEGIETKDHLIFLQKNLCDKGQGYLFSKPVSPEELVSLIPQIEKIVSKDGVSADFYKKRWEKETLKQKLYELQDTLKQQQGIIFKIIKKNGKFIHTLCDGELLYRMRLTPELIIGKELEDFAPKQITEETLVYYRRAWEGKENIFFEGKYNDVSYLTFLKPILRFGKVVEVIGSSVDITKRKRLN